MHEELMEQVVTQDNATAAWLAVTRNGDTPGINGMTMLQRRDYVGKHRETIRAKLLVSPALDPEEKTEHGSAIYYSTADADCTLLSTNPGATAAHPTRPRIASAPEGIVLPKSWTGSLEGD